VKHPDFKLGRHALDLLSPLRSVMMFASIGATLASGCGPVEESDTHAPEPYGEHQGAQTSAAVIYAHWYYEGASQSLAPGNYDIGALTIGNDQLSSLKVPAGWTVKLYRDAGFQGTMRSFTSDTGFVGEDFNDQTSSIQVIAGPDYPPPQSGGFQLAAAPDAESLKYALASNPTIINRLARLANDLGYAWCGGTATPYVGQDFHVYRDWNGNYVMQARYNEDDPYADGYWADKRLKITLSNFKLLIDPSTLTYGAPLTTSLEPIAVAQGYATNPNPTESTMTVTLIDQHTDSYTHTTSNSFTEGFKFSIKNKAEVPLFGSSELTTEFSFSATQGWSDSNTTTSVTGVTSAYAARVPPRSKKLITLMGFRTSSQVYYSGLAYLSFNITFDGFLRYSGNAHTSHPTDRPFHSVTFGNDTISGLQHILDQYDHRHIPNYSQWDWNWVNAFDANTPALMNFFRQGITAPLTGRFSGVRGTYSDFVEGPALPL
jgi:hypothetical protein